MPTTTNRLDEVLQKARTIIEYEVDGKPVPVMRSVHYRMLDAVDVEVLVKAIDRYRAALRWYADPDNYWAYDDEPESAYGRDEGRRARAALEGDGDDRE